LSVDELYVVLGKGMPPVPAAAALKGSVILTKAQADEAKGDAATLRRLSYSSGKLRFPCCMIKLSYMLRSVAAIAEGFKHVRQDECDELVVATARPNARAFVEELRPEQVSARRPPMAPVSVSAPPAAPPVPARAVGEPEVVGDGAAGLELPAP